MSRPNIFMIFILMGIYLQSCQNNTESKNNSIDHFEKNNTTLNDWHPELIPINREEGYHTHHLGITENGFLFFGYETFLFPNGFVNENWQEERLEYALVYLFDKKGNHVDTKYRLSGKTNEISVTKTNQLLNELLYLTR